MRITGLSVYKVKSFDDLIKVDFDADFNLFSFSGRNGSGKSTILKSIWLAQRVHFCKLMGDQIESNLAAEEALRYLNGNDSFIELRMDVDGKPAKIKLHRFGSVVNVHYESEELIETMWNPKKPSGIILFVDASKSFSEETLKFDDISIGGNNKYDLALEAIMRPGSLFSGIYRQLVKDYIHGRLIPSKPDRLLYFRVASEMFRSLIPNVELKNFSGNNKPGEFVLLGKANTDKRKPLYDVRDFSSGEKALLSTLAFLCISKSVSVLIIDEPENHFHESLLLEFVGLLSELCSNGGLLNWTKKSGSNIKDEWLDAEYADHKLNQVLFSTHSKSLIYKTFSMGQNLSVGKKIEKISYDQAEAELRKIGLSTVLNRVLFVEGSDDNEVLNRILRDKNISVVSLKGSTAVVETFKKLSVLRRYISDAVFVFLVDSDNKPDDYFCAIRDCDPEFYDRSFIKLDKHEIENYFLVGGYISAVANKFRELQGDEPIFTPDKAKAKILDFAKESLAQLSKKELSLSFQNIFERFLSESVWGNKKFDWSNSEAIKIQIQDNVFSESSIASVSGNINQCAQDFFHGYDGADEQFIIDRCDGKQVLGKVCSYYGSLLNITNRPFKRALIDYVLKQPNGELRALADNIRNRYL